MPKEVKARFRIKEGKISMVGSKLWQKEMLDSFPDGDVIGVFKKPRKMRSNGQNSYYHGIVIPEVLEGLITAGFEPESLNHDIVHDMLRHKFLTEDLPSPEFSGEFISIVRSTTSLTTTEFMSYIEAIQRWSAEFLNHIIPSPNEQKEINFL